MKGAISCAGTLSVLALVLVAACTQTCGATPEKLAALRRGMSYQETSAIMGCAAKSMSPPDASGVATGEWDGPGSPFLMATDIDFLDSRLLYYSTRSRGGY